MKEKRLIKNFKKSLDLIETKYFVLDLFVKEFSPKILAQEAIEKGLEAQLGFVSEIFYRGSKSFKVKGKENLHKIYKALEDDYKNWKFLHPNLPDYGKAIIKQSKDNQLNQKWKIYSNLDFKEARNWIDLYIKCGCLKTD